MVGFPRKIDASLSGRVEDMRRAFEADAFFSALSLALSLPDICGKRMHPDLGSRDRYSRWFDRYVAHNYEDGHPAEGSCDRRSLFFNGEDCYQLRCVLLHEGTNAPHVERGRTVYNLIQFRLFGKDPGVGIDHVGQLEEKVGSGADPVWFRQIDLDMAKFVDSMARGVASFLEDHPEENDPSPLEGAASVFYAPILDFRSNVG